MKDRHLSPLHRQTAGEHPHFHRALLLYAMQDEDRRSYRAVAKAVGRSDGTIRRWKDAGNWHERIEKAGEAAQPLAIKLYHDLYRKRWGREETRLVEPNMSVPTDPLDRMPGEDEHGQPVATPGVRLARQRALDDPMLRKLQSRYARFLEGAVARFAQDMVAGKAGSKIRNVTEAIAAMNLSMRIQAELDGTDTPADLVAPVVETVRVRQAKASGGDIMAAIHDDAVEIVAITTALVTRVEREAELVGE